MASSHVPNQAGPPARHASRCLGTGRGASSLLICLQSLESLQASGMPGQRPLFLWSPCCWREAGSVPRRSPVWPSRPRFRSACSARPGVFLLLKVLLYINFKLQCLLYKMTPLAFWLRILYMKKFSLSEFPEPSRLVGRLTRSCVSQRRGGAGAGRGALLCSLCYGSN